MRTPTSLFGVFALAALAALTATTADARPVHRELAGALIYPVVLNQSTTSAIEIETFVEITNVSSSTIYVRVMLIDGGSCSACRFDIGLGADDSEVLVVTQLASTGETRMQRMDGGDFATCPYGEGFAVVTAIDRHTGEITGDNVLFGSSIVAHYSEGWTQSVPALPLQGTGAGDRDGDGHLDFNGPELARMPEELLGQFLAPSADASHDARLFLLTPGMGNGLPPATSCTIETADPDGNLSDVTYDFGCWTQVNLEDLLPTIAYVPPPPPASDFQHGSLRVACEVDGAVGGVYGVLSQVAYPGTFLRHDPEGPVIELPTHWATLLHQRGDGDPVTFFTEICNDLDDDGDQQVDEGCDDDQDGWCDASIPTVGSPDLCVRLGDCDDTASGWFSPPPEVTGVVFDEDTKTLQWDSAAAVAGPGVTYEVVRVPLSGLPLDESPDETCVESGESDTTAFDGDAPADGAGYAYIVRAVNDCGAGAFGDDSSGTARESRACP